MTRIRAAWSRFWAGAKRRLGLNAPGWGSEPQDEGHAYYRTQYERLVTVLPTLPRGQSHPNAHERKNTLLAFSSILEGLHNYGDNPILPPGVRRIVVRENRTRLAALGEVGQPSFMGRFMASLAPVLPYVLLIGLIVSVTGWGGALVNGWRADRMESQRDRAVEIAEQNAEAAARWQERAEHYRQGLADAANVARHAADALEAERAARARQAARERRRIRELQNVLTGSPDPPEWRLRESNPDPSSEPAPSGR